MGESRNMAISCSKVLVLNVDNLCKNLGATGGRTCGRDFGYWGLLLVMLM